MEHADVERLRERHPAWRLLRAGNAPLVLTFLGRFFVEENNGATSGPDLIAALTCEARPTGLTRDKWLCQQEEPKWLAPCYKWTLVLDALKRLDRKSPGTGPHPRSAEWERTYGQAIVGETCARQVGTVQRWYDAGQRDAGQVRAVAFGVDEASAIERAVGAGAESDDFEERLTGYLDQFVDCRWPRLYLTAEPLVSPPERG